MPYPPSIATDPRMAWMETLAHEVPTARDPRSTIIPVIQHDAAALTALAQLGGQAGLEPGRTLGEGGMGIVRSAMQVALGREVAVKTLRPDGPRTAALDLLREAWVTGGLEHPNIVPVHYLELDARGVPLIVMKRISGVEWSKLCHDAAEVERRFGARDLLAWNLDILLRVLDALRYAHSRGVVHRDLKPSNVMIGDFGEVYLLDWGIAVSTRDNTRLPHARDATELAGTPSYMAPEMVPHAGAQPISERTDIYLAGAVLFELIAGAAPHAGSSVVDIVASVLVTQPVLPASAPPELAALCARAMARVPEDRFASVDELQAALRVYISHRGAEALVTHASTRLAELASAIAEPNSDGQRVNRLFGACRFGFLEALAAWADNPAARAGLVRATVLVAEYELAAGRPEVAESLLHELDTPPLELVSKVEAAVASAAQRRAELEALHADHDAAFGTRTRSFLTVFFGTIFTIVPSLSHWNLLPASHGSLAAVSCAALIVCLGVVAWARTTLSATRFNRRAAGTLVSGFFTMVVVSLVAPLFDLTMVQVQAFVFVVWGSVAAALAIHLDPWLFPSAFVYYACVPIVAYWPEVRWLMLGGANAVLMVNAFVRWRPATLRMTAEERKLFAEREASARGRARSRSSRDSRRLR